MREDSTPGVAAGIRPLNRILAALPRDDWDLLATRLVRVSLETRDVLIDLNRAIEFVHFPETSMVSMVSVVADGTGVETATIGWEGVVGMPLFHGADRATYQAFCQIPGEALRLPAEAFVDTVRRSSQLTRLLHRYAQALLTLTSQSSACNRLHSMRQRCARWLLHAHDSVGYERGVHEFQLTHQFLSQMLGVRRATVTETMGDLQRSGAITYERGRLRVVDRAALEAAACECHAIVRSEYDRLMGTPGGAPTPNPLQELESSRDGKTTVEDPGAGADSMTPSHEHPC